MSRFLAMRCLGSGGPAGAPLVYSGGTPPRPMSSGGNKKPLPSAIYRRGDGTFQLQQEQHRGQFGRFQGGPGGQFVQPERAFAKRREQASVVRVAIAARGSIRGLIRRGFQPLAQ